MYIEGMKIFPLTEMTIVDAILDDPTVQRMNCSPEQVEAILNTPEFQWMKRLMFLRDVSDHPRCPSVIQKWIDTWEDK